MQKSEVSERPLQVLVLGLTITSSWDNRHAATWRSLLRGLAGRGHNVLFLERDAPFYARRRDMPAPPFCRVELYASVRDLQDRFAEEVRNADVIIVGSGLDEGAEIAAWVTRTAHGVCAFYDLDTPVTIARLRAGENDCISPALVPEFHLYFSLAGGPALEILERELGSPAARVLPPSLDPEVYFPQPDVQVEWDLGFMGNYRDDRQAGLEHLMLDAARRWGGGRFSVAGARYPETVNWPANVQYLGHLDPHEHCAFYARQRFTLNVTRAAMVEAGWCPARRLLEAAASGTPIISDPWPGLESMFEPGSEILTARSARDVETYLVEMGDSERRQVGERARARVLARHTGAHRALELEKCVRPSPSTGSAMERELVRA